MADARSVPDDSRHAGLVDHLAAALLDALALVHRLGLVVSGQRARVPVTRVVTCPGSQESHIGTETIQMVCITAKHIENYGA